MEQAKLAAFNIMAESIVKQMKDCLQIPHPKAIKQEYQKSNWAPLIKLVGERHASDFMLMGNVEGMILYKHKDTRRYLNIDATTGRTYRFVPAQTVSDFDSKATSPHYELIPQIDAIQEVFG